MLLTIVQRILIADGYLTIRNAGLDARYRAAKICGEARVRNLNRTVLDGDDHTTKRNLAVLTLQVDSKLSAGTLLSADRIAARDKCFFLDGDLVDLDAELRRILIGKARRSRAESRFHRLGNVAVLVRDLHGELVRIILLVTDFIAALIGQVPVLVQSHGAVGTKVYRDAFARAAHAAGVAMFFAVHRDRHSHRAAVGIRAEHKTFHLTADALRRIRYGRQRQACR